MFLFVLDDNNTRVLFEKVLSSMPKDKARFVTVLTAVKIPPPVTLPEIVNAVLLIQFKLMYLFIYTLLVKFGGNSWNSKPQVVTWPA